MKYLSGLRFGWGRRLPMILQTQTTECGLASLAMVANFWGHDVDLLTLRHRFSTSLKGATLGYVMVMANRLGFASRALRLELDELDQLRCPCILHWDMNHFVVLKKVSGRRITIHDPAQGVRELSFEEASKHFTGVALELAPSANFQRVSERKSISIGSLIGSVFGLKSALAQVLLLSVALEVFGLLTPFYMQWVMDQVLVSADYDLLTLLSIGFLMVVVFRSAITALRSWVVTWFSSLLSVQWTTNVFAHLLKLPMDYFEKRHIGDIVSRFGSLGTIQETLTTRFVSTLLDGVMAVATLAMLFVYSGTLTWLVLGLFAAYGIIRWIAYRPFRQANEDQIVFAAKQQSQMLETIRGVQAIKLGNKQESRVASYANAVVDTTNKNVAVQRLSISFSTVHDVIASAGRIALIWLAARQVLQGEFSAGMLISFVTFADQFTGRASGLIDAWIDFRMLRLHTERLADIVLTEPEQHIEAKVAAPAELATSLEIQNVSFRYSETEPWVLNECSLRVEAGESVAIVGPSGQGKTTLVKLILGLLEPELGGILVGGVDIRKLGLHAYRDMIGCVMQDDILFAGSIADNIGFFDSEPDQARIEEAGRLAGIHDDIVAMAMGYQTLVGDMGSSLSGGQCQRVLLARALYRKPAILVLDEATSHLDVEREKLINDAIRQMKVTRIIIAHRPETIRSADRVIVLDQGTARSLDANALAGHALAPV